MGCLLSTREPSMYSASIPWVCVCVIYLLILISESACKTGDPGLIPGSGSPPGEGNGTPLQYSCLENPWTEEPGRLQFMGSQELDMT